MKNIWVKNWKRRQTFKEERIDQKHHCESNNIQNALYLYLFVKIWGLGEGGREGGEEEMTTQDIRVGGIL